MSIDHLSDALNAIKVHEMVGKQKCKVKATKMIRSILEIFKKEGYIKEFNEIEERGNKFYIVDLDGRINNCGVIKPRMPIKKNDWAKIEQRFIPAIGIGTMIVSTPKGIMTNNVAQDLRIGGRLIAYVY
ncbi:MAG: 30S ribosomal protein S8 [Candidatus ainarchaeum sp.]|nr:30S ribosomal protein S8 [Candidatus ainarchaeum sp.]